jgi:hypothetical protein
VWVGWDLADDGGAAVEAYEVMQRAGADAEWTPARLVDPKAESGPDVGSPVPGSSHGALVEIRSSVNYVFRVRARTHAGAGAFSAETEPLECAASPPLHPTALAARALGSSVAELAWDAPGFADGVAELRYVVQVAEPKADDRSLSECRIDWREAEHSVVTAAAERRVVATVHRLRASTDSHYRFRVCASNAQCGRGNFSAPSEPLRLPPALPSPPLDVRAAADGPARLCVSWRPPADDGGMEIVGYALQSRSERSAWADEAVDADATCVSVVCAARAGATLSFRVAARNGFGRGGWSEPTAPTGAPVEPPSAPTGVQCEACGPACVLVRWCAPADDGGADVTYEVSYKDADAAETEASMQQAAAGGGRPSSAQRRVQRWYPPAEASEMVLRPRPELCSMRVVLAAQRRCGRS